MYGNIEKIVEDFGKCFREGDELQKTPTLLCQYLDLQLLAPPLLRITDTPNLPKL